MHSLNSDRLGCVMVKSYFMLRFVVAFKACVGNVRHWIVDEVVLILWLCYSEVYVISFQNSGRRELFLLTIVLPSVGETLIIGVFSL